MICTVCGRGREFARCYYCEGILSNIADKILLAQESRQDTVALSDVEAQYIERSALLNTKTIFGHRIDRAPDGSLVIKINRPTWL